MDTKIDYNEQVRACEKQIRDAELKIKKLKIAKILSENDLSWLKEGVYISYQPLNEPCTTYYMKVNFARQSQVVEDDCETDQCSARTAQTNDSIRIVGTGFSEAYGMMFHTTVIETGQMEINVPLTDINRLKELSIDEWVKVVEDAKERMDIRFLDKGVK